MNMSPKMIAELDARDFLTEEFWVSQYRVLNEIQSGLKRIKGRPSEEERALLKMDAEMIRTLKCMLFHSVRLSKEGICPCPSCADKRQAMVTRL